MTQASPVAKATLKPNKDIEIQTLDKDNDIYLVKPDDLGYALYLNELKGMKPGQSKLLESWSFLPPGVHKPKKKLTSVGTAEMKSDGTLWLKLRSDGGDGAPVAEAMKIVKPDDKMYSYYLKHMGKMKPGETKSIPPFED